jgi:hypothetical protein
MTAAVHIILALPRNARHTAAIAAPSRSIVSGAAPRYHRRGAPTAGKTSVTSCVALAAEVDGAPSLRRAAARDMSTLSRGAQKRGNCRRGDVSATAQP